VSFSGRRQNADIADTLQLRDVAMATNFGTAIAAWTLTEDNDMRLWCKGWLAISHLWQLAMGTAPDGRLSGWELTR